MSDHAPMGSHNYDKQTDAEFLRSIAHAIEVDDPLDTGWVQRLRDIAGSVERRSTWPEVCPTCGAAWRVKSKTMGKAAGQPHSGTCMNGHRWSET